MDNGLQWALAEECEDIIQKLQNIILTEKKGKESQQAESERPTSTSSNRKRNKNRKKNKKENKEPENSDKEKEDSDKEKDSKSNNRRRQRRPPREDRWFGRFHCKMCGRMWESAYVFTRAGTKHVLYKQRCKSCRTDEAWYYPFGLELITCSICGCHPCECYCEVCGALSRPRFVEDPETGNRVLFDRIDYCQCEDDSYWLLGDKNDERKPHLSYLCGRCQRGRYCRGRLMQEPPEERKIPISEEHQ